MLHPLPDRLTSTRRSGTLRRLFVRAWLTASQGGLVKLLLTFWFPPLIAVSFCVAGAFASGGQTGAQPTPLLQELNALAQQQLDRRAVTIAAIRDLPAAATRQAEVRRRVLTLIGGLPDYHGALNAKVTKTTRRDGFSIDNVRFESLPGYYVTANLYRPDLPGRHPAILMSMGHWESGKAAGQLLSTHLARKGFVVLAYDPVGQGERQQAYDARVGRSLLGGATEQHFTNGPAAILMGQSCRPLLHPRWHAGHRLSGQPSRGRSGADRRDRLFWGRHADDIHRRARRENQGCRGRVLHELVPDAVLRLDRRFRAERAWVPFGWSRPDGLRRAVRAKALADRVNNGGFFHPCWCASGLRGGAALVHAPRRRQSREMGRRTGRSRHAARSAGGHLRVDDQMAARWARRRA